MRIAHFSDLHLLSLEGVKLRRFFNKRLTGYANLRLKRGHVHKSEHVRSLAREIRRLAVDHVVITGDLTNLALEPEFALAREVIEKDLGLSPRDVTIVPGNHDVYTHGAEDTGRFASYFGDYLIGDLPDLAVPTKLGPFPVVKLRGAVAFVGLCSAVARLPFVAAGRIGLSQLDAFRRVLAHPDVARRTPVIALHHPPHNPHSRLKATLEGLDDAALLWTSVSRIPQGMVLHGHLHRRVLRSDATLAGRVYSVGATSASLEHEAPARAAGFNVYEVREDGSFGAMEAHVLVGESFETRDIPTAAHA